MDYDLERGHGDGGDGGGGPPRGGSSGGGDGGGGGRRIIMRSGGGRGRRIIRRRGGAGAGDGAGGRRARQRREQRWMNITLAIHTLYLTCNGVLYMLIQIKYQNQNNPFEIHMAMKTSSVAFCVYFCAVALEIMLVLTKNKLKDLRLLKHVTICSGILSPLSSIVVLFYPNLVGWIVVVLFGFATTILLAYDVFKLISSCISKRNNINCNDATPNSESLASETSTGINHNEATTSEMRTGNNFAGSTHTPYHSFFNN